MSQGSVFDSKYQSETSGLQMLTELGVQTSDHGLSSPNVRKFINSNDQHFDLIFNEQFFQESWLLFAHKFNAPIVSICE